MVVSLNSKGIIMDNIGVIPLGRRKLVREGKYYKIYVPRGIGDLLVKHKLRNVFVYIATPREVLEEALQGGD